MKITRSLLGMLLCYSILNVTAREIFIAVDGDDSNSGTKAQPLASLAGAKELINSFRKDGQMIEEIKVVVEEGKYYMTEPLRFTENDSGSGQFPITFTAAEGASPVFIGGLEINHWVKVSDKLWKTTIPEVKRGLYFEQLYVNGKRAIRAKSPNNGFYVLKDVNETVIDKGEGRSPNVAVQSLKVFAEASSELQQFDDIDFNEAVVTFYHKWDNTRKRIISYDANNARMFIVGEGMKPWNVMDNKTRFIIENYRAALDTGGEWYLEKNGDLYYVPRKGEMIEDATALVPILDHFIILKGRDDNHRVGNIHFTNLRFQGSGYQMPLWGNEPAQAAFPIEAAIMVDFAENIRFQNCEITHTGTNAIWFRKGCENSVVKHCIFEDLGAGGVKVGAINKPENEEDLTHHIEIDNNIIRSGGYVFPCAVGVTIFQASDIQVTHNEIANFRYSGVSVGWIWGYDYSPSKRNTIAYNHIHHIGWGELSDMGGVYCLGESEGTIVNNNVIHHIYSFDYGGWGLYTDEGSTGIVMENNLVYACKNSGFHQHYGKENVIKNNIFANNMRAQLQATRVEDHISFYFTNNIVYFSSGSLLSSNWDKVRINSGQNCYWDTRTTDIQFAEHSFKGWKSMGNDKGSLIADPGFVNPQKNNFHLKNLSIAKKIDFQPFDFNKAGVYGDEHWINRGKTNQSMAERFDEVVATREKLNNQ